MSGNKDWSIEDVVGAQDWEAHKVSEFHDTLALIKSGDSFGLPCVISFVGPPMSGKSTVLRHITNECPERFAIFESSAAPFFLESLHKSMVEKKTAIVLDMFENTPDDLLTSLVRGEPIEFQRKHKTSMTAAFTLPIVVVSNHIVPSNCAFKFKSAHSDSSSSSDGSSGRS